jgi:hypothetical protein
MSENMKSRIAMKAAMWFALIAAPVLTNGMPAARADSEIPAGTRFVVELRDKLDANKVKRGKKFEARTVEALQSNDGRIFAAGAKLKGRVSYAEGNRMMLRFEQLEIEGQRVPMVASVSQVIGERGVERRPGQEGEIESPNHRGRDAAIGAGVGGGIGAAAGAAKGGGQGAAIGAGAGAALGALIGASQGSGLVLQDGTRLELQLDRPLFIR